MTLRDRLAVLDGRTHSRYSSEDIDGYVEIAREAVAALEGQRGGWMDGYREGMNDSDAVYILQIKQRDELLREAYHMLHSRKTSMLLDGFSAESEIRWINNYESQTGSTLSQVSTIRDREGK